MRYPLPADTAAALNHGANKNHNVGLALDRYLQVNAATEPNAWKIADEYKQRKRVPKLMPINKLITAANERFTAWLSDLQFSRSFSATTDYRLVVGFGAEHVLETSLCLHRIYGFPLIPGSAVKGVTRARAFWDIAEQLKLQTVLGEEAEQREKKKQKTPLQMMEELLTSGDEKERAELLEKLKADVLCSNEAKQLTLTQWLVIANDFYQTFGTTAGQGKVTFFDAYPTRAPQLEADILNPHYGQYYSDKKQQTPPADYHELKFMTNFLTVAKGSEFRFAVAGKDQNLVGRVEHCLCRALQEMGIGGKTAAGYGFWIAR